MFKHTLIVLLSCLTACTQTSNEKEYTLWYNTPAKSWMNEALPIGNGYMGAMFFGGVPTDEIQISEEGIWAGGPGSNPQYNGGNKKESWKQLARIRSLLTQGRTAEAGRLANTYLVGEISPAAGGAEFGDFGAQQPFGSLLVTIDGIDSSYTDYRRQLNISQSLGSVSFQHDGTDFQNFYFASYPARLVVMRYINNNDKGVTYRLTYTSPHKNTRISASDNNTIQIEGTLESNGERFEGIIWVRTDGTPSFNDNEYKIENARNVEFYVSVASSYKNEFPHYTGNDFQTTNRTAIAKARANSYEYLLKEHVNDYRRLFNRVSLSLNQAPDTATLPTDQRLLQYSKGAQDFSLEELYFQYGRYLLISSSRPGTMPATLQGKWNHLNNPPWACDYHMNINLQMIYWPAEVTNLSECHTPLLQYIESLREPGRITAREYFNARGWSVHTMNNAYGFTAPGWNFYWGYAPNSASWLGNHIWEHYLFTQDTVYLRQFAYPILQELGEFWLDYLIEDSDSTLVSSPSYSPEHGDISIGATIDQEVAWELFTNLLKASRTLGYQNAFTDSIQAAREKLSPLKIGQYGQLQEWKADLDDPNDKHRHISHLYALHPSYQINPTQTPELAKAAEQTLKHRGEDGTGWSLSWKINFWARLQNGNTSYKMLRYLLTPSTGEGSRPSQSGSYANLLWAHPPFQIDGNMGAVAGMAEMLLQSYNDTIRLLPAIPLEWKTGEVTGLRARGGYTVDIKWESGWLRQVTIHSDKVSDGTKSCVVKYCMDTRTVTIPAGKRETSISDIPCSIE